MAKSDQLNGDGHSETIFKYPEIANAFSGSQRLLRNGFSITSSLCKRSTLRKKSHDSYDSLNIIMSHYESPRAIEPFLKTLFDQVLIFYYLSVPMEHSKLFLFQNVL